jgi:hypothetical protein
MFSVFRTANHQHDHQNKTLTASTGLVVVELVDIAALYSAAFLSGQASLFPGRTKGAGVRLDLHSRVAAAL